MHEWNSAMAHIENRLTADISGAELASIALTSEYHFRRMFSTLAGMPLSEYIRKRRLTAATAEVISGNSVLDVAVKYGYGSADAFTRAFRSLHGLTPTQARLPGAVLRSQSQLKFHVRIEGSRNVHYRIVEKEAFRLVGFRTRVPLVHLGRNEELEKFERNLDPETAAQRDALSDVEPTGVLAVTEYVRGSDTEVDYWHAVATTAPAPAGADSMEVPASRWVVFTAEGEFPEALQHLWGTAAAEWFPANPYQWAPGPQLLHVEEDDTGGFGRGELWIPIADR